MVIGRTLARHFALVFVRAIGGVFAGMFALVYLLDFVELLRRGGDNKAASASVLALMSLLRVPAVIEQVLPFIMLFGAMIAFIGLTRRLELVVARAAGLSVWQFLAPAVGVAFGLGVLLTVAYNPLAANFQQRASRMESAIFGGSLSPREGVWLRQRSVDGQAILRADHLADDLLTAVNVSAFVFDRDGSFSERINAPSATLEPGVWRFTDAHIVSGDPTVEPHVDATYLLATTLTPDQLTRAALKPDEVPFWTLPTVADQAQRAGLDATPFKLRYDALLARPLLLVAMVLLAAVFSLRFFRSGGVARMATGGVAAGFALYVVTKLTSDLGGAGILNAGVAAWSPAAVGTMLATFVLLHQEDG